MNLFKPENENKQTKKQNNKLDLNNDSYNKSIILITEKKKKSKMTDCWTNVGMKMLFFCVTVFQ